MFLLTVCLASKQAVTNPGKEAASKRSRCKTWPRAPTQFPPCLQAAHHTRTARRSVCLTPLKSTVAQIDYGEMIEQGVGGREAMRLVESMRSNGYAVVRLPDAEADLMKSTWQAARGFGSIPRTYMLFTWSWL